MRDIKSNKWNQTGLLIVFFVLFVCTSYSQNKTPYGNNSESGKYFTNNNVKIYYEIYGQGKPLLLFHGNGGSIAGRASYIEEFSKKYKVIAVDSRCHGKSDCPPYYLTYEQMAEDMNALLKHLNTDSAFVWGHSDGAIIGLLLAIHHPEKVKKLLSTGANLRPDTTAVDPEIMPLMAELAKQASKDSISLKRFKLLSEQPHIALSELRKIKSSVLVMAGDRDVIRNEHTLEIFNNIPNALLCILPGTTHYVYKERKQWFTEILYDFFDNPPRLTSTVDLIKSQK